MATASTISADRAAAKATRGPIDEALNPLGLKREVVTIVGGLRPRWRGPVRLVGSESATYVQPA
jgi:hypothetical protein